MRFMILVKANADSEAGVMPTYEELAEMGRFNEELVKAGVLLAGRRANIDVLHNRGCLDFRGQVKSSGPVTPAM